MVDHTPATPQPPAGRVWLDVPFAERDDAKVLGAYWDQTARRWFDPRPPTAGLDRWAVRPDVPDLLPGEDRTVGDGLFVDIVPKSCWFTNVRTCVTPQDWERLRRMITTRAAHRCEACGAGEDRTTGRRLEAHERWAFDDTTGVQALRRLICLCSDCHLATHMGFANVTGRANEARAHLAAVTGMSTHDVGRHIATAGQLWIERSRRAWALDLAVLTNIGITLTQPAAPRGRAHQADQALQSTKTSDTI